MSPTSPTEFSASYDLTTKIISFIICGILIAAAIRLQVSFIDALFLLLIALTYAYSPRAYIISDRSIIIKRLIKTAVFLLKDIREARPATKEDLRGCIRLFGNGGLFGYYGWFYTAKLGK